jgi:anti-sigma factor RsiW
MQCPEIKELLSAWLDGETPAAESAAVAAHLEVCPSCRREAAVLQRLDEALGGLTAPGPGDLAAKVRARLSRPRPWYRSLALAACLVLGLGLGGGLTRYLYAPPGNGELQELAGLDIFQDFPQGSLGTAISFPGEEDNHT